MKPNEAAIPKRSEADTGLGLDKSFVFLNNFGSKYELREEVGRDHFGYTCAVECEKGELRGQRVAVKFIHKAKLKTARDAVQLGLIGSAIGAVSTAIVSWKYSRSLHGLTHPETCC